MSKIFDESFLKDQMSEPSLSPFLGRLGLSYAQGSRTEMEDTYLTTVLDIRDNQHHKTIPLYGIFDGHSGNKCANYIQQKLPGYLSRKFTEVLVSGLDEAVVFNILKLAFVELGAEFRTAYPLSKAGSTADIALIIDNNLWVVNVGDTRAILCMKDKVIAMSEDAKPNDPKYRVGIEKRGGSVVQNYIETPNQEPILDVYRVNGKLAMARAVGHNEIESGVNPRAKLIKFPLSLCAKGYCFLVIASDGLWDVVSSKQVSQTIEECVSWGKSCAQIADKLVRQAYAACSKDNISVLIVNLDSESEKEGVFSIH